MSGLLEYSQASGNDWGASNSRLYRPEQRGYNQPKVLSPQAELADLEVEMERFEAEQSDLEARVQANYVIDDVKEVTAFLRSHRRLPLLLLEAIPHLRESFGPCVTQLRRSADEGGWEMLYVTILWGGDPEAALEGLNQFDDAWWIANSYPAGTSLTFTYKLI